MDGSMSAKNWRWLIAFALLGLAVVLFAALLAVIGLGVLIYRGAVAVFGG